MSATNQKGQHQTNPKRLRPHAKWARQLIALSQCQLGEPEREEVEAHLAGCPACKEAYVLYDEVASLMHEKAPPALPPGLPPMLQDLKDQVLAKEVAAAAAKTSGRVTTRKSVPRGAPRKQSEKKKPAKEEKTPVASSDQTAGVLLPVTSRGKPD